MVSSFGGSRRACTTLTAVFGNTAWITERVEAKSATREVKQVHVRTRSGEMGMAFTLSFKRCSASLNDPPVWPAKKARPFGLTLFFVETTASITTAAELLASAPI